jgi:Ankyrin repeats (many copies)
MNEVPPGRDETDDADDLYRRASALDESRPSELVRRRVLGHAAQLAAERAAQNAPSGIASARGANRTWRRRRPAIFGTLAAAALAGLVITPRFFTPSVPPGVLSSARPSAPPPQGAPPSAPPMAALPTISAAPPAADSRNQEAPAPAAPEQRANRIAGPAAELAGKDSPAKIQNMAAARSKAAASAGMQADARRDQDVASTATSQAGALAQPMAPLAASRRSSDPAAELRRAAEIGDLTEMQTLLDKAPLIEARDENGRTALMLAALHGQSQAVDVLLAHGADPNAADGHGTTPLQAAVAGNQQAIAAALRRAGAR